MGKKYGVWLAGVMLCSMASAQQVYKWVDSKGKVHYGDVPVATKSKKVDTRPQMKGANNNPGGKCPYAR